MLESDALWLADPLDGGVRVKRSFKPTRAAMEAAWPIGARGALVSLLIAVVIVGVWCHPAAASRPRRPSASQIKKMREQMEYVQAEMMRYRNEMATKEKEIFTSYDENGNGKLEGAEKAKYNKYLGEVKSGKAPNPFSGILPPGKGPKTK